MEGDKLRQLAYTLLALIKRTFWQFKFPPYVQGFLRTKGIRFGFPLECAISATIH